MTTREISCLIVILLGNAVAVTRAQTIKVPAPTSTTVRSRDVSMEDYRQHLASLISLVDACAKGRDLKTCDPALIGPDDRIPIISGTQTEHRLIRYGWLRVLFSRAEDPDESPAKDKDSAKKGSGATHDRSSTSAFLDSAKARLQHDIVQSQDAFAALPPHVAERAAMRDVLATPEFRTLQQSTVRDSILEKIGNWLNRIFESAAHLKARSAWVGRAIVWGFILGVCIVLAYSLLRLERKWRIRLTPDDISPAPGTASARDWQLWLEDARRAAAAGEWRQAIHFLYWAAISRLESRRLWPADRARTPREYLALVAQDDPRKAGLSQLTGLFERFWYGGRAAGESDYKHAETVATSLIGGNTSTTAPAVEGGAR